MTQHQEPEAKVAQPDPEKQGFNPEAALARYAELMHIVRVGAYSESSEDGSYWYPDEENGINISEGIERLEVKAGVEGLYFCEVDGKWALQPMSDFDRQQFLAYHTSEYTTNQTEATCWHVDVELPGTKLEKKRYHLVIVDGTEKIDIIVSYGPSKMLVIEPYLHHEMDYTVHDSCNHQDDYCVLEDPDSSEFNDAAMEGKYHNAVQKLMGAKSMQGTAKENQ